MIQGFSIFLGLFQVMTRQTPNQDLMHVLFGNNSVWEFLGVNNEWIVGISSMIGWWFSLVVSLVSYFKHAPTRYLFHPFSYRIPRSSRIPPDKKKTPTIWIPNAYDVDKIRVGYWWRLRDLLVIPKNHDASSLSISSLISHFKNRLSIST